LQPYSSQNHDDYIYDNSAQYLSQPSSQPLKTRPSYGPGEWRCPPRKPVAPTQRRDEQRVPSSASASKNRERSAGHSQRGQSPLLQSASTHANGHQSGPSSRSSQSRTKGLRVKIPSNAPKSSSKRLGRSSVARRPTNTSIPLMKQAITYRDEHNVSPLSSYSGNGDDTIVSPS
jgi:hypothetical protein